MLASGGEGPDHQPATELASAPSSDLCLTYETQTGLCLISPAEVRRQGC